MEASFFIYFGQIKTKYACDYGNITKLETAQSFFAKVIGLLAAIEGLNFADISTTKTNFKEFKIVN